VKASLKPGLRHRFSYTVPESKTVPFTYPEAPEIASMPKVFATGFMVVLMEWTCIQLMASHLDAGEGSLGIHVNVSHSAATRALNLSQATTKRSWRPSPIESMPS